MREDLELINRFLNGNREAFEMLVKKYQNRTINTAYSLVGNVSDAEDIAQDVFLKIYRSLGTFNAQAKFSSWLYRITVNTVYDFLRGHKHKAESLEETDCENIRPKDTNRHGRIPALSSQKDVKRHPDTKRSPEKCVNTRSY